MIPPILFLFCLHLAEQVNLLLIKDEQSILKMNIIGSSSKHGCYLRKYEISSRQIYSLMNTQMSDSSYTVSFLFAFGRTSKSVVD